MPDIYKYFGFIFAFYVTEHLPVHVHVSKQDRESKKELHYAKEGLKLIAKDVKGTYPLTAKEIKEAKDFVNKYHLKIVEKWNQVFIFGKKVTCETIKERI